MMSVILLYSIGTTLAYLLYLGFAWRVIRTGGLTFASRREDATVSLET